MNAKRNRHPIGQTASAALAAVLALAAANAGLAQPGWVLSHQKISDTEGGFTGTLDEHDWFGYSLSSPGDLDGDGVADLAVGAEGDDDGGSNHGAVWVLFLDGVAAYPLGDMNCDGRFNGGDIDPFFLALGDPAAYAEQFPN